MARRSKQPRCVREEWSDAPMTARRSRPDLVLDASEAEVALAALDAEGLRALVRDIIATVDPYNRSWIVHTSIDRAARSASGWIPEGPTSDAVDEIVRRASAARRVGEADAFDVDRDLRQASKAYLAKDYAAAFRIFDALLVPMSGGHLYLGQDEMVDKVLGADVQACAGQYVVSMYMTSARKNRAKAVLAAMDDVRGLRRFWEPLRELERVVVEPLPELEAFLSDWRMLVEERVAKERHRPGKSDAEHWLREVVGRMEGRALPGDALEPGLQVLED